MRTKLLTFTALMAVTGFAGAEVFSITSGYDLTDPTQVSVDAGYASGDVDTLGIRVNYRFNPEMLIFGALGSSEVGSESDLSFGAGLLYTLPDFGLPFHSGVKGSFFRWSASYGNRWGRYDVDINEFTVRYVASGNIDPVENLKWFGEIGLHFLSSSFSWSSDVDPEFRGRSSSSWDDTELGLEAGLLYDFTEAFTGIVSLEIVDKTFVNLAVRYKF